MKNLLLYLGVLGLIGCAYVARALAQQTPSAGGVPSHIVVTVEPKRGNEASTIRQEDVMVFEGQDRDTVTGWTPLKGDRAGLELFVQIDDELSTTVGNQLDDIRKFINEQPASTKVGVAYMQNGIARVLQNPRLNTIKRRRHCAYPWVSAGRTPVLILRSAISSRSGRIATNVARC